MNSITLRTIWSTLLLVLMTTFPVGAEAVRTIDKELTLAAKGATTIRGTISPGTEESWHFTVTRGKQARVRIVKGERLVVYDLFDAQNITVNEGVDENDWFPVSPGRYTVTVTNVTGLVKKGDARTVPYEIRVEVE